MSSGFVFSCASFDAVLFHSLTQDISKINLHRPNQHVLLLVNNMFSGCIANVISFLFYLNVKKMNLLLVGFCKTNKQTADIKIESFS